MQIDVLISHVRKIQMAVATHLGPWLLGTVKDTTGTTAGLIRNIGATPVIQTKTVAYADTTAQTVLAVIPAGSMIQNLQFMATTAYTTTGPTFTIFVNGVQINTGAALSLVGSTGLTLGTNNAAGATLVSNVGASDAIISFTQSNGAGGTGAGTLVLAYLVRNADGTAGANP